VADEIYRPVISDEDTESETPSPRAELDIPDPAEFRRKAGVDDADHLTTEEASDQRQRRQPDPESPESAYERPLVQDERHRADQRQRGCRCHALGPGLQTRH
jgi:hypothetical protein